MNDTEGKQFYDKDGVFEQYIEHRKKADNPNELIEKPIVLALLEDIKGDVLDLGCGYGDIGNELIARGVDKYTGIDASEKMVNYGKSHLNDPNIILYKSSVEEWEYGREVHDWVISRLVFHYLSSLESILGQIYGSLKENGKLVFSVEHPNLTSSMDLPRKKGKKTHWVVDQYFELGKRNQTWMGNQVVKFHRNMEEYWRLLNQAGFHVLEIKEGCPERSEFTSEAEYQRRKRIPLFLIIKAEKLRKG